MSQQHRDIDTRVSLLEHDAEERRALLRGLIASQEEQTKFMHAIDKKLGVLVSSVDPSVPTRLASLELTRAEMKGGKAMLAAIVAASATIGSGFGWLLSYLQSKPQ